VIELGIRAVKSALFMEIFQYSGPNWGFVSFSFFHF
jgi:hypothetical protein